jgi:hypothetical protein
LRKKEGSNIKEAIGKGVVDAPPCRVFQVIRDSDRLVEFMPYLEARITKNVSANEEYVCEYLDFPWPIWDRFVNLRIAEVRNDHENQCEYLVHWHKDETHACTFGEVKEVYQDANPHAIVPPAIDGYWHLFPQDGGKKTLAYYYGFTDPGGKIPHWVQNMSIHRAILKVFHAVRKRASQSDLYPPCQCRSSPRPWFPAFETELLPALPGQESADYLDVWVRSQEQPLSVVSAVAGWTHLL